MNKPETSAELPSDEGKPLAQRIAGHPFLQGMKPEHLALLAECAVPASFKEGDWIFREDEPANRFYLIRSGQIELEAAVLDRGHLSIETIGAGDVLGWSWLFPPYYWRFNARAVTLIDAVFFHGTRLRAECETNHDFGYELLKRMTKVVVDRLQAERTRLVRLAEKGQVQMLTN